MGCTKIIYDLLPEKLFMGYGEEQLSRTLTFDISQMQAELPGGVPMIAYMRPRDELGYLASGVTLEGSTLTWELSAHVMQYKGIGGAQIVLVDESGEETHILKSHVMQMLIGSSIPLTGGEPPEPWETWLEQILAAAARAESAAADAEAQADRAETAEAGAEQALIDAGSPVLYGRAQTLKDAQQQTARGNIAAASAAEVSDLKSATTFNREWATKAFLPNEGSIELMDLTAPASANRRSVVLDGNIIKKRVTVANPTGSTYYSFVISNTPRYVQGNSTTITSNLTEADFSEVAIDSDHDLILHVDRRINRKTETVRTSSVFYIGTYSKDESDVMTITFAECGETSTPYDSDEYSTSSYVLTDLLPEIRENKNLVIVFEARYPNVEEDYTLSVAVEKKSEFSILKDITEEGYTGITDWQQGVLRPSNGLETDSATRCRSAAFVYGADLFFNGKAYLQVKDGYGINVFAYSKAETSTDAFVGALFSAFQTGLVTLTEGNSNLESKDIFYRFTVRKNNDAEFAPSDLPNGVLSYPTHKRERSGVHRVNSYGDFYRFRFYVPVDLANYGESPDIKNVRCILQIPASYQPTGKPTPLIMYGHGGSGYVSDSGWGNVTDLIDMLCANGYAVFDVNNTLDVSGTSVADEGCLTLMLSYLAAWRYIRNHYNVSDKLSLLSCSMGSFASLNMLKWYGANINTAILTATRVSIGEIYERMNNSNKQHIADVFNWPDGVTEYADAIEHMYGWDDYLDLYTDSDSVKKVNRQFPPIKVMVGTADTDQLDRVREYFAALKRSGNVVIYSETEGATHHDMCELLPEGLKEEAVAWFDRFNR